MFAEHHCLHERQYSAQKWNPRRDKFLHSTLFWQSTSSDGHFLSVHTREKQANFQSRAMGSYIAENQMEEDSYLDHQLRAVSIEEEETRLKRVTHKGER